jgi:hypothetical protein
MYLIRRQMNEYYNGKATQLGTGTIANSMTVPENNLDLPRCKKDNTQS